MKAGYEEIIWYEFGKWWQIKQESYTKHPFTDVFKIGVLKIFVIFTGKHWCWSLFLVKLQAWGLQQRYFLVNITKFLRTAFFIEHLRWLLLIYSNQLKIFWEISASKFQGQHATQFSRYEGLCPATKTEIHCGFSNGILQKFRAASFKNNFGGLLLKRKQRRRRMCSDPCGFRFSLFPGELFIY